MTFPEVDGRLITYPNTAGQVATSASGTSGAIASATWVEVVASLASDTLVVGVAITGSATSATSGVALVQVGIGAAASETSLATMAFAASTPGTVPPSASSALTVPILVSAGQRLSLRAQVPGGGAYTATLLTIPWTSIEGN